jgi:hypothetical protein
MRRETLQKKLKLADRAIDILVRHRFGGKSGYRDATREFARSLLRRDIDYIITIETGSGEIGRRGVLALDRISGLADGAFPLLSPISNRQERAWIIAVPARVDGQWSLHIGLRMPGGYPRPVHTRNNNHDACRFEARTQHSLGLKTLFTDARVRIYRLRTGDDIVDATRQCAQVCQLAELVNALDPDTKLPCSDTTDGRPVGTSVHEVLLRDIPKFGKAG